jgi:hypothetical protein
MKEEEKPEKREEEMFKLEQRKVKALEKIANSVDALTVWFEEIDKTEWSERVQWYLSEFYRIRQIETGEGDKPLLTEEKK